MVATCGSFGSARVGPASKVAHTRLLVGAGVHDIRNERVDVHCKWVFLLYLTPQKLRKSAWAQVHALETVVVPL
jgi:hypothetical protein